MKRLLILILALMVAGTAYAADQNLTNKDADTSPTGDDIIYVVDDPGGTPADKKVTLANIAANMPAIVTATVNTGQGDNELYDMDQNVLTTSDVTFGNLTASTSLNVGGSGTEGLIVMPDSDGDDHNLTVSTADPGVLHIDGIAASGSATPGGSDTYVQFNDGGSLGGDAGLVYNKTANDLTVSNKLIVGDDSTSANLNFVSTDEYIELQVNGNKIVDLTEGEFIFAVDVQEYGYLTLSGDQTTNITAGNEFEFDGMLNGNLSFSGTTHRVTLTGGKKYSCLGTGRIAFSGATGSMLFRWFDVTNSKFFGTFADSTPVTNASAKGIQPVAFGIIEPSSDTDIELQITTSVAVNNIKSASSYAYIEEII